MFDYIKRKIAKHKRKRTFKEYGHRVDSFDIKGYGNIEFAQWLHPSDKPKVISLANVNFYKKLAKEGGMIIDIGAHTGDTTVPMAVAVGKQGLVLGLEPNKYVFKILEKNSTLNKEHTNIKPLCFAATDSEGEFTFNYSDASYCNGGFLSQIKSNRHGHNHTLQVQGKNLEKYLDENYNTDLDRLELIKIDAEGYDKEIIKTIKNLLSTYKPNLMIECYKRLNHTERNELFDLVDKLGYNLYKLENFEAFDKLDQIHRENMMDERHFEILAIHSTKSTYQVNA